MKLQIISAFTLCFVSTFSFAEKHTFSPVKIDISVNEQKKTHPLTAIGTAIFKNGVQVPAYSISVPMGTDETDEPHGPTASCHTPKCYFAIDLPKKLAANMRVYNIAETDQWILAPAEWTRLRGAIGVNGNTVLAIASADQKSNLSLYSVPACVGCGLDAATPFFPEAAKENQKTFGTKFEGIATPIHIVRANKQTVYYQYQLKGQYQTNGVAKYRPNEDNIYDGIKVTVAPDKMEYARIMLNFFSLTHK
jgi:hypothetical protein